MNAALSVDDCMRILWYKLIVTNSIMEDSMRGTSIEITSESRLATVRSEIAAQRLRVVRAGRRILVPIDAISEWLGKRSSKTYAAKSSA